MDDLHAVIADLLAASGDPSRKVRLRVISGSMRPLIQPGDMLVCVPLIGPVALEALRCGDIIIVRRQGDFLSHRLIRRRGEAWYTKGDRHHNLDAPAAGAQILAHAVAIERGTRTIDLTCWEQRMVQRLKGWWGAAAVVFYQAARAILRR